MSVLNTRSISSGRLRPGDNLVRAAVVAALQKRRGVDVASMQIDGCSSNGEPRGPLARSRGYFFTGALA